MTTTLTHDDIHADHRNWLSDVRMWREDITAWQQEQQSLLAELERAIGLHGAGLREHAEAIGVHEGEVAHHEHFVAECEKTARRGSDAEASLEESHRDESAKHAGQRDVHERLKQNHHRAMVRMQLVIDALTKAV